MCVDTPVTLGLAGLKGGYEPGTFLWIVNNTFFQYFSVLITLVSAIVMVGVSLLTEAPDYGRLQSLTFATVTAEDKAKTRAGWGWKEVLGSAVVLAGVLGSYLYFRG
jgi:SSS family solute:Na+ symporter